MAFHTRSGVHGIWMSSTPRCRTASTMALTTAGVEAMVPASPTPLVPSVFVVDSEVVWSVTKLIVSAAVGSGVVDEGAGDQGALVVVLGFLAQGLRDALHEPAVHLALDDQRVDDLADVVDAHVLAHLGRAGLGVDLHGAQVGAVREREVDRVVGGVGVDARLDTVGQVVRRERREGDVGDADALVGALDREAARRRTRGRRRWPRAGAPRRPWPSRSPCRPPSTRASPPTTSEREP